LIRRRAAERIAAHPYTSGGFMLGRILGGLRRQHLGALALFLTLGGTSYAAVTLEAGSVGSREIRNRSVKMADLGIAVVHKVRSPATP
jgi:hypothetical protein